VAAARLRISGGTARGLPIAEPRGLRLRPTTGLVREAIFNIIGDKVEESSVLDLFAGTGALGIEALSRGAARAVFIDAEQSSCQAILQTLARAGFADSASVLRGRLPNALSGIGEQFDIVFIDPPYDSDAAQPTLVEVHAVLREDGLVVYEHGSRYNPAERPVGLRLLERRVYGDSAIALYALQEG
jgi:16S rRNA (guanine966-N2)-methyltransferase